MKSINSIDRSFQNQRNEVQETDIPKSGFNMTYRNHLGGLVLGRLYPQSIQHLMPGDKFSGSNTASLTFEQLSTPVVDDMDVCVHNFFVTLRSIDKRWEDFMTPTKLNNMNKGVKAPTFDLSRILFCLLDMFSQLFVWDTSRGKHVVFTPANANFNWDNVYLTDALADLSEQIDSILGYDPNLSFSRSMDVTNADDKNKLKLCWLAYWDFFVGKRSLFDFFGYTMFDRQSLIDSFNAITLNLDSAFDSGTSANFYELVDYDINTDGIFKFDGKRIVYPLQNEYALRAYYAIWFEYYRNYDLEPRSTSLPEYKSFAGASIFGNYTFADMHYLVPRIRSWQQDAFTTAGIDDISRHIFAPVLSTTSYDIERVKDSSLQPDGIIDNNTIMQTVDWRDPSSGQVKTIEVPMPSRLLSALRDPAQIEQISTYGVELFSLRKAQMLENYLKRIYYGGDEYRDRMLHLYGARIEDYRINRPQWLSSSLDMVSPRQEVANTGVAPGASGWSAGSRLVTATAEQSGSDTFTEFCSEFGIYMSILSIMPHATYDPYLLQNMNQSFDDFPIPQFANQMEDVISTKEISRHVDHSAFGYAPYGHAYRYRVDEIHGDYHDDKYDYVFLRYFAKDNVPNLSWGFLHCRPKLPMFVNQTLLDGQVYGTFKHNFLVERPLPTPVEVI